MTENLAHRGPDGSGQFEDDVVVLGHRRLSIIDLVTGDQPFVNADRSLALVYNGELYNYLELREELRAQRTAFSNGVRYRSHSPSLRGVGYGLPRTVQRHVGVCIVGRTESAALLCARSPRRETLLLLGVLRRVSFRIGNEGAVRCGQSARNQRGDVGRHPLLHVLAGSLYRLYGDPEASCRLLPDRERWAGFRAAVLGDAVVSRRGAAERRGANRGAVRGVVLRQCSTANAQRRPCRRVLERRARFRISRRCHERRDAAASAHLHDRVR